MARHTQTARKGRATNGAREAADVDAVIREHAGLVRRIAYCILRRLPSHIDVEDLVQAGFLGLLKAARQFKATRSASFATYAGTRIRGAIIDSLRQGSWGPRGVPGSLRDIAAAVQQVESKTGQSARPTQIAAQLGLSSERYHRILRDAHTCRTESLQALRTADGYTLSETLPDERADVARDLERQQLRNVLVAAIDALPERERAVILLYYGEEQCLREIGGHLRVTESRVSQIHAAAVERLRGLVDRAISREPPDHAAQPDRSAQPRRW